MAARKIVQPKWKSESERVANIQGEMQAATQALLKPVTFDGRPFVIRELTPYNDKLQLEKWQGKGLEQTIHVMGQIVGWANLRARSYRGSAAKEELVAFGHAPKWAERLIECAEAYADRILKQQREFAKS